MRTVITADRLWDGNQMLARPIVLVEEGKVISIASHEATELPCGIRHLNYVGVTLAPSFFDVHIHGAAGHDVMEATPEALDAVGAFLAQRGTGSYLATTVTAPMDKTLAAVAGIAKLSRQQAQGRAQILGIHLEGPFLSPAKCGVQPVEHMLKPDIAAFDRLFDASEGTVRLMTIAPEMPGAAELTAHATSHGVRVSVGHSNASTADTRAAIAAGATSATHTFNAMRPLDHREPGILGTVLACDDIYAEIICDGIHCEPEIVKLWWRAKGPARGILVTDAMSAAGMPDGEYQLGGFPVQVANGRATARGVLAGSVLTLDRALSNFLAFTGASLEQGLRLLSVNPAAMTGLGRHAGSISIGKPANMVAVDTSGQLQASIIGGEPV